MPPDNEHDSDPTTPNSADSTDEKYGALRLADDGKWRDKLPALGIPDKFKLDRFDEREFLPAALEIMETPANPVGRSVAISLAAFFTLAMAWAFVGTLDIVAVAQGRIVPSGGINVVQPLEAGIVRAIHVEDGQRVTKGQLLIELDPTENEADEQQLRRERLEAIVEVARLDAIARHMSGDKDARLELGALPTEANGIIARHAMHFERQVRSYRAQLAAYDAELVRGRANRDATQSEIAKYEKILPLLEERASGLKKLWDDGFTSKQQWLEVHTSLITARQDQAIQRHKLSEAKAGIVAARRDKERFASESVRTVVAELSEAQLRLEQTATALQKIEKRVERMRLRAPLSGTVQQLAVRTVGGVVKPAETLLNVVPENAPLEVRASILNKDKGFVHSGQDVELKIEAFPFTKYGTIKGMVANVSSDAIIDEKLGLIFDSRIDMHRNQIAVGSGSVNLTPGMTVTAEIKTGSRRVIEFLMSPLLRYRDEAMQER